MPTWKDSQAELTGCGKHIQTILAAMIGIAFTLYL